MASLMLIIREFRRRGWTLKSRPFELNLIGVRSVQTHANSFDDTLATLYRDGRGRWNYNEYPATTDPGTYWLKNPPAFVNSLGLKATAILAPGQYPAYSLGLHRDQYTALCQRRAPVRVVRDYNRDSILDFYSPHSESGYFGINIHAPSPGGSGVDRDSAGCQVFQRTEDFQRVIDLAQRSRERYGNQFTYSLIDLREIRKRRYRNLALFLGAGTIAAGGMVLYHDQFSRP